MGRQSEAGGTAGLLSGFRGRSGGLFGMIKRIFSRMFGGK
jgi:hypothetical protein